jgi:plasmid stabilization system protein ParE
MRPVRFHPRVEADLDDAVAWYDGQQCGLGDQFISEFREIAGKISKFGSVVRQPDGIHRHLQLPGFPYLIFYREDGSDFLVMMVINAARSPALIESILGERH